MPQFCDEFCTVDDYNLQLSGLVLPSHNADPLQAIRSGNYPVMDKDHILVLNWNRQTIPLLRQLALTRSEQQGVAAKHSVAKKHNFGKSKGMFLADK